MKIVHTEVSDVIMPKEDPKWKFALGARPESVAVLLTVHTEHGAVGHGIVSEIPHLGYPLEVVKGVITSLADRLVGADIRERRPMMAELERHSGDCRPAMAAVEMAIYDAAGRLQGVPVYQLMGGAFRKSIPVLRILSIKQPEEIAANALKLVNQGYRYLKIKIDNEDLELDAARIRAVRAAVGDSVHLTLDANQSYTPKDAVTLFRKVESERIDLFEQPVNAKDWDGLKYVTDSVSCLVEADESAYSKEDIYRLVKDRAVDCISMKVLKLGGIDALREVASLCEMARIRCRVGANVGSRLLNAAAMHFVAATPNIGYACEVGEFERLLNDPFEGLSVQNGVLTVPEGPGLGVNLKAVGANVE